MREDGYLISLYYSEPGVEATFAAGFGGSTQIEHLSDAHRVELSGGRTGMFIPVSCRQRGEGRAMEMFSTAWIVPGRMSGNDRRSLSMSIASLPICSSSIRLK
jgi:hypothetical protein